VLAATASILEPLGLTAPVVIAHGIFMQTEYPVSRPDRRYLMLIMWQRYKISLQLHIGDMCLRRATQQIQFQEDFDHKYPTVERSPMALQSSLWPSQAVRSTSNHKLLEQRVCLVPSVEQREHATTRFSKYYRLIRTIDYCFGFTVNCKMKKEDRRISPITAEEVTALLQCVEFAQRSGFWQKLHDLSNTQEVSPKSTLESLMTFLNTSGLLHVAGCLKEIVATF
jgi:hypothetical protein